VVAPEGKVGSLLVLTGAAAHVAASEGEERRTCEPISAGGIHARRRHPRHLVKLAFR
jgi:hypothetical protein